MVSDAAMPLDTRFNEVEGGKDLYPNDKGVWTLVEEGEMKVRREGGREGAAWLRWLRYTM
jgi:hypothetical protein